MSLAECTASRGFRILSVKDGRISLVGIPSMSSTGRDGNDFLDTYKRKRMNANNSIASFWNSYLSAGKETKLLAGKAAPTDFGPVEAVVCADEIPGDAVLEAAE